MINLTTTNPRDYLSSLVIDKTNHYATFLNKRDSRYWASALRFLKGLNEQDLSDLVKENTPALNFPSSFSAALVAPGIELDVFEQIAVSRITSEIKDYLIAHNTRSSFIKHLAIKSLAVFEFGRCPTSGQLTGTLRGLTTDEAKTFSKKIADTNPLKTKHLTGLFSAIDGELSLKMDIVQEVIAEDDRFTFYFKQTDFIARNAPIPNRGLALIISKKKPMIKMRTIDFSDIVHRLLRQHLKELHDRAQSDSTEDLRDLLHSMAVTDADIEEYTTKLTTDLVFPSDFRCVTIPDSLTLTNEEQHLVNRITKALNHWLVKFNRMQGNSPADHLMVFEFDRCPYTDKLIGRLRRLTKGDLRAFSLAYQENHQKPKALPKDEFFAMEALFVANGICWGNVDHGTYEITVSFG